MRILPPPVWALVYIVIAVGFSYLFGWPRISGLPIRTFGLEPGAIERIELSKHMPMPSLRSQAEEVFCTQCSQPESEWNSDRLCTSLSGMNSCIM
jgi:hypothetical protein